MFVANYLYIQIELATFLEILGGLIILYRDCVF